VDRSHSILKELRRSNRPSVVLIYLWIVVMLELNEDDIAMQVSVLAFLNMRAPRHSHRSNHIQFLNLSSQFQELSQPLVERLVAYKSPSPSTQKRLLGIARSLVDRVIKQLETKLHQLQSRSASMSTEEQSKLKSDQHLLARCRRFTGSSTSTTSTSKSVSAPATKASSNSSRSMWWQVFDVVCLLFWREEKS